MLSISALPKPFRGHIGVIQRNAIGSWKQLRPECEIFLFGDEEGTAEVAKEFGVNHIPHIARNEFGTPTADDVFRKAEEFGTNAIHCIVNCDIILGRSLLPVIKRVTKWKRQFLVVGQCWDIDIKAPVPFECATWEEDLGALLTQSRGMRGQWAIDYFVFPRGLYRGVPPFALGRAKFDNWLVWKATDLRVPVVDATRVVRAIHQTHDYSHVLGGKEYSYYGVEAMRNQEYAGGPRHCLGICHSTHRLLPSRIRRNWARYKFSLEQLFDRTIQVQSIVWRAKLIMKYRVKPAFWRVMERSRAARHALGLNGRNLSRLKFLHRKNG